MLTGKLHNQFVYNRRMEILSDCFADMIGRSHKLHILDVGCGDGKIARLIMEKTDVSIEGIDVLVRDTTYIPVKAFDGKKILYENDSFDSAIIIDVLHHSDDPLTLLKEVKRVVQKSIFIKDHLLEGLWAGTTLKFMDYVGNDHFGVRLPYNYMKKTEWLALFEELKLSVSSWNERLNLYSRPWHFLFDRGFHFIADLSVTEYIKE